MVISDINDRTLLAQVDELLMGSRVAGFDYHIEKGIFFVVSFTIFNIVQVDIRANKMLISADNNVKHPLQNEWSFWMNTNREKNWEANILELTSFNTVEDYWCLYHHMKVPSELKLGQDYMVFKKGIRPMWEDKGNKKGGRWLLMLDGVKAVYMDSIWSDVVLLLIGETFEHSDDITGVVANVRDKNKISVWMRTTNRSAVMEIGRKLRMQFRIPCRIHYYRHNSSASMYSF